MDFPYLSSPVRVGQLTLKNRILMAAMHTLYGDGGLPSPRFNEFYWRRAQGGAGLIVVGACRFDGKGAHIETMRLDDDGCIAPWKDFTKGMHQRDCPVALQLYHAGRYLRASEVPDGGEAIAPSAVYTPFTRETARAMSGEDIRAVIAAWTAAAVRAREAGFDAVEISASAGYLISQFLSPLTNLREDEYGGSFENRCRFPLELIRSVRAAVGDDYTLALRFAGHTLVPGAGGSDDCRAFAPLAEQAGIDLLDVTGGWHESRIPQLTGELPQGGLLYLASAIKKEVGIPVAMANRLGAPRAAEEAVALGRCDLVAMGRPLVAEPDLPRLICEGRAERVRPCLSCNQGCLAGTFFQKPIRCLANPAAGREWETPETRCERPKRLLVAGAGPAGLEAALTAARRGHKVTVWEAASQAGGQLSLAARLPAREDFARLIEWYVRALGEAGAELVFNKRADVDSVLAGGFDACILAEGRRYKAPPLDTADCALPCCTAERFLLERPVLGRRVAVVGGSFVGLEIARLLLLEASLTPEQLFYLMRYGAEPDGRLHERLRRSDREVAVFERGKLGAGYEPGIAWPVLGDLKTLGAKLLPNTEVLALTDEGVLTAEGLFACDGVLLCPGTAADDALWNGLRDKLPCRRAGNAARLGRAIDAIRSGFEAGRSDL